MLWEHWRLILVNLYNRLPQHGCKRLFWPNWVALKLLFYKLWKIYNQSVSQKRLSLEVKNGPVSSEPLAWPRMVLILLCWVHYYEHKSPICYSREFKTSALILKSLKGAKTSQVNEELLSKSNLKKTVTKFFCFHHDVALHKKKLWCCIIVF